LLETRRPKGRGQSPNKVVILPIVILVQRIEDALCEYFRGKLRCLSDLTKVPARSMEDADHRSTAVIAASENRIGERHEPPYQFERFGRIGFCHLIKKWRGAEFRDLRPMFAGFASQRRIGSAR